MENQMLCYQCESTADGKYCNSTVGICGKTAATSYLQDALTGALIGLAKASVHKSIDEEIQWLMIEGLCATAAHTNFDEQRLQAIIDKVQAAKMRYIPKFGDYNTSIKIPEDFDIRLIWQKSPDIRSLKSLLLFGIRGIATYAYQSWVLGYKNKEASTFFHKALIAISANHFKEDYFDLVNEMGDVNLRAMELLIKANSETYGQPSPVDVPRVIDPGPFIVVSGHNYKDLEAILDQTADTGINVYSHCEMLPAHGYPKFKKYPHFKGHYGTGWQNQQVEFDNIPAAIVFTTNCIMLPLPSYVDRVFTTGTAGLPGILHIEDNDFRPVLIRAIELNGAPSEITFPGTNGGDTVKTGFGKKSLQTLGYKVAGAMADGDINHIFVIGGCDGFGEDRQFFTDILRRIPVDSVVLTYGCCKFRFNDIENNEIGGVPRIVDAGQCGDLSNVVEAVEAIAASAKCRVEELPLTWLLSWQEQRSIANLFSLFAADVQNVIFGPKLPPFFTPNVFDVYAKEFNVSTLIRDEREEAEEASVTEREPATATTATDIKPVALAENQEAEFVKEEPVYEENVHIEEVPAAPETYTEYREYEEPAEKVDTPRTEPLAASAEVETKEEDASPAYTPEELEDRSDAAGLPDWAISDDNDEIEETEETEEAITAEKPHIRPEDIDQTPAFLLEGDEEESEAEADTVAGEEEVKTAPPPVKPKIRPEDIDQTPAFLLEDDDDQSEKAKTADEEPSLFTETADEPAAPAEIKATKTKKMAKSAKTTKKTAVQKETPSKAAKSKNIKETAAPSEKLPQKKTAKKPAKTEEAPLKLPKGTGVSGIKDAENTFDFNQKPTVKRQAAELKEIQQPPKLELPKGAGVSGIKDSEETLAAARKEPYRYQPPRELKEIPKLPPVKLPKGAGVSGMKDSGDQGDFAAAATLKRAAAAPAEQPTSIEAAPSAAETSQPATKMPPNNAAAKTTVTIKEETQPTTKAEAQSEATATQAIDLGIPKGKGVSGWKDPDENPAFDRTAPNKPYQYAPPRELKEISSPPPIPLPEGAGVSGFAQRQPKESSPSPVQDMYSFAEAKPEVKIPKGKGVSGWKETDEVSFSAKNRKSNDEKSSAKPWLENSLKELKASLAEDNESPDGTAPTAEEPTISAVETPQAAAVTPAAVEAIPPVQDAEIPAEPLLSDEERSSKPWLESSLQELKASIAEDETAKDAGNKPWLAASLQQLKKSLEEDGSEPVSAKTVETQATAEPPTESAEVPVETWHKPPVQPKSWQDIVPAAQTQASSPIDNAPPATVKQEVVSKPPTQTWQKPAIQPKPWDRDLQTTWQKPPVAPKPWEQQQPATFHEGNQAAPVQNYTELRNLPLGHRPDTSGLRPQPPQAPIEPNPYRYVERREAPPEIPIGSGVSGYKEPTYVPGQAPPQGYADDAPKELREIQQPPPMEIPLGKGVSGVRFHEDETPMVPSYDPTYYDVPQKTPKINLPKGVGISGWQEGEGPIDPAEALRRQAAEKKALTTDDLLAFTNAESPAGVKQDTVYRPSEGEELIATLGPDGKVILAVRGKNNNR